MNAIAVIAVLFIAICVASYLFMRENEYDIDEKELGNAEKELENSEESSDDGKAN